MNPILTNCAFLLCQAGALVAVVPTAVAQDKLDFAESFETYRVDEPIISGRFGDRGWRVAGIMERDVVTVTGAMAFDGQCSLLLADHDKGRPRMVLDLVKAGAIESSLRAGRLTLAIKEDDGDDGAPDAYVIQIGGMSLMRKIDQPSFWFRVEHATGKTVPFRGVAHTYTPGAWNTFSLEFDDQAKSVVLSINGVVAATIGDQTADYSAGSLTVGTYSSTGTGDAIFIDAIKLEEPAGK